MAATTDAVARPRRRDSVLSHEVSGEIVLYDQQKQTAVGLNLTAAAIWELCDGTNTVADIAATLAEAVGLQSAEVADDVERLVTEMTSMGLFVADMVDPVGPLPAG